MSIAAEQKTATIDLVLSPKQSENERRIGLETPPDVLKLPPDFLWSASLATEQNSGFHKGSDWYDWERRPGKILDDSHSEGAWNFLEHYREYFELAAKIGCNSFRFSIDPTRWENGEKEIFVRITDEARARNLEPVITLFHFVLPQKIQEQGGWTNPATVNWFLNYVREAVAELGDKIKFWLILNEPTNYLANAYGLGTWPPGRKMDALNSLRARKNMLRACLGASKIIRAKNPKAMISIAADVAMLRPYRPRHPGDQLLVYLAAFLGDWQILKILAKHKAINYIGLNYYTSNLIKFNRSNPGFVELVKSGRPTSDIGWEINPEELERLLIMAHRKFHLPIFITESGIADEFEKYSSEFYPAYLGATARAIKRGARVIGFGAWTLVDNFEWEKGFSAKFGLYSYSANPGDIVPRHRSLVFSRIAKSNSIEIP